MSGMTRERAKEILEGQKNEHYKEELNEALDMAILALSAIEKIRAEIAELEDGISSYFHDRPWIFKDEALAVIDKYIGGG